MALNEQQATSARKRLELTERQLDRRLLAAPGLEAEDILDAHEGEYVTLFGVAHLNLQGTDYDGRRYSSLPGRPFKVSKRKAEELLAMKAYVPAVREGDEVVERAKSVTACEVYDERKHKTQKVA